MNCTHDPHEQSRKLCPHSLSKLKPSSLTKINWIVIGTWPRVSSSVSCSRVGDHNFDCVIRHNDPVYRTTLKIMQSKSLEFPADLSTSQRNAYLWLMWVINHRVMNSKYSVQLSITFVTYNSIGILKDVTNGTCASETRRLLQTNNHRAHSRVPLISKSLIQVKSVHSEY